MFHRFNWTAASAKRIADTIEHEPAQPFFLLALAETAGCRTFLDVGANIGAYTMFATLIPPLERCIAFEAAPDSAAELRRNARLNNANVEIEQVAVSDGRPSVRFSTAGRFAARNSVSDTALHSPAIFTREIEVPAIALDNLLPLAAPVCVKIDVEGHEPRVLAGAERLLSQNACVVQIEDYQRAEIGRVLGKYGHSPITAIGPDHYYSNIDGLRDRAVQIYERAMVMLIESNHQARRPIILRMGDLSLQLDGRAARALRSLKAALRS